METVSAVGVDIVEIDRIEAALGKFGAPQLPGEDGSP
jgi:phosphopantetheinyl transferase (holo-ACP synthase)